MDNPDTITLTSTRRGEVQADKVDIHATIQGTSLITGSAALKKAKEVAQLVRALGQIGIAEEEITLKSIHAESSSGILGKSTSATYQLRIRCAALDVLSEILGVVTSQKNAKLDFLDWRYPEGGELKTAWLQACLTEAKDKAGSIASNLGVELTGVHTLSENWYDSERDDRPRGSGPVAANAMKFRATGAEPINLGFPLSHSKWVELQLEIKFRISSFKTG